MQIIADISWNGPFIPGEKYYITVEACNGADLCTIVSSDGLVVDNSLPVKGLVEVGPGDGHNKYLSHVYVTYGFSISCMHIVYVYNWHSPYQNIEQSIE